MLIIAVLRGTVVSLSSLDILQRRMIQFVLSKEKILGDLFRRMSILLTPSEEEHRWVQLSRTAKPTSMEQKPSLSLTYQHILQN